MTQDSLSDLSLSFVINRLPLTSNLAYLSLKRKNGSSFRTLTKDGKIWKQVVADAVQSAVHKSGFPMDMDEQGVNLALLGYTMEISIHQNMTKKSIWRRDAESGAKLLIDSMREVIVDWTTGTPLRSQFLSPYLSKTAQVS